MEIQEVHAADALSDLKTDWQNLVERCSSATIYQTWEWNAAWWNAFRARKRLRLILITRGGQLVCLAPFYTSFHLNLPLRRMAFLGTGVSDYLDIITDDSFAREAADSLIRYLDRRPQGSLGDLQQLKPGSPMLEAACSVRCDPSLRRNPSVISQEPCPYLPLPGSWDEFNKALGKKMRSNIGYYTRLLGKTFDDVELTTAGDSELDTAMKALFDLHQKRWKARLLPGVMGSAGIRKFHRAVAQGFRERDWLRLHLLKVNGKVVSALYCFEFRRRYYYYLGGFEPELGKFSPGTVLTASAIQNAIQRGCEEFDFLRGSEPYKYRWQPEERINHRVLLADSRNPCSRAMLGINRIERIIEHRVKEFAENRGRSKKQ